VERAFKVLQAQFTIVKGPTKILEQEILCYIMMGCVIMHNMVIENERGQDVDVHHYE
jgi:hypothetical protein